MPRLSILLAVALTLSGCFGLFDPDLIPAGDQGPGDQGALAFAEMCGASAPLIEFPAAAGSLDIDIDTTGANDDIDAVGACTGSAQGGPDLFLGIEAEAQERWHFHIRVDSDVGDSDPAIYVLSGCDERGCSDGDGLDVCEANSDEHFTFVPATSGSYTVAFDSSTNPAMGGGFTGSVEAYRTVCGDGAANHSEGCDDGNDDDLDDCDNTCRQNLSADRFRLDEIEVNDDAFAANHLRLDGGEITVAGSLRSGCDVDFYLVDVPAGQTLTASLTGVGGECNAAYEGVILELWRLGSNQPVSISGTRVVADGANCLTTMEPVVSAGPHWVRVVGTATDVRGLDYDLCHHRDPVAADAPLFGGSRQRSARRVSP